MGNVDPLRDIEVINTELLLADLQSVETQLERTQKRAKAGNKDDLALVVLLQRVQEHLNGSQPAYTLTLGEEEVQRFKTLGLLTGKPVLYACNVAEKDLSNPTANAYVQRVQEWARQHTGCECCFISAKLEAELADLPKAEADDFLKSLGVKDSGVSQLIRATYHLLGLASFFTAGEKEVRAGRLNRE
jgi:ribosome-binding ATPase YchF (GTP1/OBG family)